MQSIRQIERLNQTELEKVIPPNASWHTDYRDTAYLYIGGLPFELSEGDILTIFSQYGNPVHVNLVRDKDTGKSRGFCFLKYEDQRSCDLAVDNLSGAGVMGRVISVDHTRYKKKEGEVEGVGEEENLDEVDDTDKEGDDRRKRRRTASASESEEERPMIKEEIELAKLIKDIEEDDPMKEFLVKEKRAEVEEALKAIVKHKSKEKSRSRSHRHHHRSRHEDGQRNDRDGSRDRAKRNKDDRARHRRESHRESRRHRSRTPVSDNDGARSSHRPRRDRSGSPGSIDRRRHRSRRDRSASIDGRHRTQREVERVRRRGDSGDDKPPREEHKRG
jgi:RNA-binding motif X-linked protein 2